MQQFDDVSTRSQNDGYEGDIDDFPDPGEKRAQTPDEWMEDWHPSRRNPDNICKYISDGRRGALVTVYCREGVWRVACDGQFPKEPFATREDAQEGARGLLGL